MTNQLDVLAFEMARAEEKFGPINSPEEAYGAICEEQAELLDAIRSHDWRAARAEAVQLAGIAMRFALNPTTHEMTGAYRGTQRKASEETDV
jgi:hypothetical protein